MRALVLAAVLLMTSPAMAAAQTPAEPDIVVEARAFMESYARDLLAGAPAAFEWRDLVFIPSGEDAITVIGRFVWTSADGTPDLISYHGQFVREDGELRILVRGRRRRSPPNRRRPPASAKHGKVNPACSSRRMLLPA
jgi:hypothetical protein